MIINSCLLWDVHVHIAATQMLQTPQECNRSPSQITSDAYTTPINLQVTPSHELAVITRQKRHHIRHIIRMSEAAQRRLLFQLVQALLGPSFFETGAGVDDGGVDCVDADGEFAEFFGGSECDSAQGEFAGGVGDESGEATETGDAGS
jgi:hypothetical protein